MTTQSMDRKRRKIILQASEEEVILQMLQTKIRLPDGSDTHAYSYGPENEDGNRLFSCHLCWTTNLIGILKIREHLSSDQHSRNVKRLPNATHLKLPMTIPYQSIGEQKVYFKIYAGENILQPDSQIKQSFSNQMIWFLRGVDDEDQKKLSKDPLNEKTKKDTMLGLSYLGKFKVPNDSSPQYFCFLCEESFKSEKSEGHMKILKHKMNYLKVNFSSTYKQVQNILRFLNADDKDKATCDIFRKIYQELERMHGYRTLNIVSHSDFTMNFIRLSSQIYSLDHYGEEYSDFAELRVAAYITALIRNPQSYKAIKPPPNSEVDVYILDKKRAFSISSSEDSTSPPAKKQQLEDLVKPSVEQQMKQVMQNSTIDKEQRFRDEVCRFKAQFQFYEKHPKMYENYSKEWHEFYQSHGAQLRREGINLDTYNFQNDWNQYWTTRCQRLLHNAIETLKAELLNGEENVTKSQLENLNLTGCVSPVNELVKQESIDSPLSGKVIGSILGTPPTPPAWNKNVQTNDGSLTNNIVQSSLVDANSILRLLLALENLMSSLGTNAVQLLDKAIQCQQDSTLKASFATICKELENHLTSRLGEVSNIRILKIAVDDLSAIVGKIVQDTASKINEKLRETQIIDEKSAILDSKPKFQPQSDQNRSCFDFKVKSYGVKGRMESGNGYAIEQNYANKRNIDQSLLSGRNYSPASNSNFECNKNVQGRSAIEANRFYQARDSNLRNMDRYAGIWDNNQRNLY